MNTLAAVMEDYPTQELQQLHEELWESFRVDDQLAEWGNRILVRNFPDWREECAAVEAELLRRGLRFEPLPG